MAGFHKFQEDHYERGQAKRALYLEYRQLIEETLWQLDWKIFNETGKYEESIARQNASLKFGTLTGDYMIRIRTCNLYFSKKAGLAVELLKQPAQDFYTLVRTEKLNASRRVVTQADLEKAIVVLLEIINDYMFV